MKNIITISLLLLASIAFGQLVDSGDTTGTLVTSAIRPNSQDDNIATAYTNEVRGTIKHVVTYSGLDSIKSARLVPGTLATVADSNYRVYQWSGSAWDTLGLLFGGNPVLKYVTTDDTLRWATVGAGGNPILALVTVGDTTRWGTYNEVLINTDANDTTRWGQQSSGMEVITEAGNTGHRFAGEDATDHEDIGEKSTDMTKANSGIPKLQGASGDDAFSAGTASLAAGNRSLSIGYASTASGDDAVAIGSGVVITEDNQTGIGSYNTDFSSDTYARFIVGVGETGSPVTGLVINNSGRIYAPALVTDSIVGDNDLVNYDLLKEYGDSINPILMDITASDTTRWGTSASVPNYVFTDGVYLDNDTIRLGDTLTNDVEIEVDDYNFRIYNGDVDLLTNESYFEFNNSNIFKAGYTGAFGGSTSLSVTKSSFTLAESIAPNNSSVSGSAGSISLIATSKLSINTPRIDYTNSSVYIGKNAGVGDSDPTAYNNTAVGWSALNLNSVGSSNTAIGYGVLKSSTSDNNTGLGNAALWSNTTGSANTALGQSALALNTSGIQNTAVGKSALYYANQSGNVALGNVAGQNLTDESSQNIAPYLSTFIGYNTMALNNNDTNQIVIGANTKGKGSNTVVLGNSSITDVYMGGNGRSVVKAGRIDLEDDNTNLLISTELSSLTTGYFNTIIGFGSGAALENGFSNIAIGNYAMASTTGGSKMIAIGENSLENASVGANIGVGVNSLNSIVNGYGNIGIGNDAFMYGATSSGRNIAIGHEAGKLNKTGSNLTLAESSIYIGAGVRPVGGTREIVIGAYALGNGPNTATLGDDLLTDIYMGENGQANVKAGKFYVSSLNTPPSSASDTGTAGEIRITTDYIYICVATDTWKRVAISTW